MLFASISRYTHSKTNLNNIIQNGIGVIKERITIIDTKIQNGEKIYFNPSKTAQNAINFLNKELITELLANTDIELVQDIFKLLNILIKEDPNCPDPIN